MSPNPVTVDGDPRLVQGLSRLLTALEQSVQNAATATRKHNAQLDSYWQSHGSDQAKLALASVERHLTKAEHPLTQAAHLLQQYSQQLEGSQHALKPAAAQLTQLQAQLAAAPADAAVKQQVAAAQQKVDTLVANHHQQAQRVAQALHALSAPPLPITPQGHLDPVNALLLNDAVAHHKMSKHGAVHAASRIEHMKGSQSSKLAALLASSNAKDEAKILHMLAHGKSFKQINDTVGMAKYFSLDGPGKKLDGKVSWFNGPAPHGALGVPLSVPGIAVYNQATLGGYWLVEFPNGKKLVLQQTDIGPAPWTGRVIDVTVGAIPAAGYTTSNFPTDGTVHARYLGMHVPPDVVTK